MSTSSDSGEEYANLKEAVDPDFLSNDLFRNKDKGKKPVKPVKLLPSLRPKNETSSSFNPFEIKTTPEFKAYVSKQLMQKLNDLIDDTEELPENNREICKKRNEGGGVKLLRSSKNFINIIDEESSSSSSVVPTRKHKRSKKGKVNKDNGSSSGDSDVEKAKEVAVTAEWILSGKATEGWAKSTRGELEVILAPESKKLNKKV